MARIAFTVDEPLPVPSVAAWQALIDWADHGSWIPATTVRILSGGGEAGTRFVARTGVGPLGFDDHMTVTSIDAVDRCAIVEKTGPLLTGQAGFAITDTSRGCELHWFEDVVARGVPQVLAPVITPLARMSFRIAITRLRVYLLHGRPHPTPD